MARFALLGSKIFGIDRSVYSDREAAVQCVDRIVAFMDEVGAPHTLTAASEPRTSAAIKLSFFAPPRLSWRCFSERSFPRL